MEQEHKRRVRYKGTHPRKYQEKYKELNPEKYQRDVEKILQQGKTPAGMHIPICVEEILQFFDIQPGQIGLDATLGYGGHSRRMLEKLGGQGHLYATDVDPIESEKTRLRLGQLGYGPEILTVRRMNFADLDQVAPGVAYDFVLADLGVSSMQMDNPARGFTFGFALRSHGRGARGPASAGAQPGGIGRYADGKRGRTIRRANCSRCSRASQERGRHRDYPRVGRDRGGGALFPSTSGEKGSGEKGLSADLPGAAYRCQQ